MSRLSNAIQEVKTKLAIALLSKSDDVLSFSQCGEDRIILFLFKNELGISRPSYIDIGANHPSKFSNTALLYLMGGRGLNIEPNPELIVKFEKERPLDINLNIGVHNKEGVFDFFLMSANTMSTFSAQEAEHLNRNTSIKLVKKTQIPVLTFSQVIDRYHEKKCPDFVNIDVEGLEMEILTSIDFQRDPPKVICIETLTYEEKKGGRKETEARDFLLQLGYELYADTRINSIFVLKKAIEGYYSRQKTC
jgi:FkbM family methyltransferase